MGINNIYLALSFSSLRTFLIASLYLSPSHQHLLYTHFNKCGLLNVDILQQSIYPLLSRDYRQSPLQLLYITSSESQSRRIARRVDGCDGWWMMVGQRRSGLSDWNHLNDGDSKTAGSGFRCGRPSIRRQQNTEQSRWLTGYFNESRIDSNRLVGGGCFCLLSYPSHTCGTQ